MKPFLHLHKFIPRFAFLPDGSRFLHSATRSTLLFLLIEFFDELNYGALNTALPSLRVDLNLDYGQVGLLLGISGIIGRSGTIMAINSIVNSIGMVLTWLVGWIASIAGLSSAMWLLLAGPISLLLFVPRNNGIRDEII